MNQKKEDLSVHQQEDGDNQTRIGALSDAGSRVQSEKRSQTQQGTDTTAPITSHDTNHDDGNQQRMSELDYRMLIAFYF